MMNPIALGAAAIPVAAAWLALWMHLRARAKRRALARAGFLDQVAPLFSNLRTEIAPSGFPRLSGWHEGELFDLQVVPDTLTYRKLPALWLLVTLPVPLPVRATMDVILRPCGTEVFSRFRDLPVQVAAPPGFPADCAVRTDDPGAMPDAALVGQHIAQLDQTRLKEVVVSPKGCRIVWLAQEADRARYLLFRDAELGTGALAPDTLLPLLSALCALRDDLLPQSEKGS
jgi:hypothetical protein